MIRNSKCNFFCKISLITFIIGITGLSIVIGLPQSKETWITGFVDSKSDTTELPCDSGIICPGEDLTYEVSWWMFKIGQIRLKTLETKIIDGKIRYSVAAFIDSYDGLPFVNLHAIDYSEMESSFFSRGFRSIEKRNDEWLAENSYFDYSNNIMVIEKSMQKDLQSAPYDKPQYDTIPLDRSAYLDGLSMLFYARGNIRRNVALRVPTIVYSKKGSISFYFNDDRTAENVEVFNRPVRVIQFEGKADFEGIFGFTGDFKGWFSDDSAVIPVKAEMRVILGSINIELKKWERKGWRPPLD